MPLALGNLLLNGRGELKISDFGVSGQLTSSVRGRCPSFAALGPVVDLNGAAGWVGWGGLSPSPALLSGLSLTSTGQLAGSMCQ